MKELKTMNHEKYRSIAFKENEGLSDEEFNNIFSEKDLEELELKKVIKKNVAKKSGMGNKITWSFEFVGIILIHKICVFIYPKYWNDFDFQHYRDQRKFKQILDVIDKFNEFNTFDNPQENLESFLALQLKILKEYNENGLYLANVERKVMNNEGLICWEETINESEVLMIEDEPFYLNLISVTTEVDKFNLVSRIHTSIIREITGSLKGISSFFGVDESEYLEDDFGDIGNVMFQINVLEQELNKQFITNKQKTLLLLLRYLNIKVEYYSEEKIRLYGTNTFNLVWETVCRYLYKDNLSDSIDKLGLNKAGINKRNETVDFSDCNVLSEIVDKPIWINKVDSSQIEKKTNSLILDVLHVNHQKKIFEIYDAKYYDIQIIKGNIMGNPGISDVTKQFLYQLAFKELAELNNFSFKNAFIIPIDNLVTDKGNGVVLFEIELGFLNKLGLNNIEVIGRDCEIFFNQYLH